MMDAVVIGAGPNGLTAACALARAGWKVLVLEAQDRAGGALNSRELTLPGYVHDVGAAFFPFASVSPAFRELDLAGVGLRFVNAEYESSHPAPDGTCASIARDIARTALTFGADADRWRTLACWQQTMGDRLPEALLAPLPALGPAWRLGLAHLFHFGRHGLRSSAGWSRSRFATEAARRIIPALALHVDLGPHDLAGAGLGIVLALLAGHYGFSVPIGGARSITHALLRRLEEAGGEVRLRSRVTGVIVRQGRAVAVKTHEGEVLEPRRAVLADVLAPALYLDLLEEDCLSGWLRSRMSRFHLGFGTFKMDWALAGPVPWSAEQARHTAVVHTGDSIDDLARFTNEVRAGVLPSNPYLVIGQQSLVDPTRAPVGGHTLWAYSRVPSSIEGGWEQVKERFAERIEHRIESLAPGFRALIRARAVFSPQDLERMNANLAGGDLGGGSARLSQQLFFRPLFPYFRHRTPIRGLYLCSASTHPGAGVHGACGWNAARQALRDQG